MFGKRAGDTLGYDRVQTLIGEGVQISGVIESTGVIRIDGKLKGTIRHGGMLIVGPRGVLEANISAHAMAVAGEVYGDLEIDEKLEILPSGKLYGDLKCGHLVVREGAVFRGHSLMASEPPASVSEESANPPPVAGNSTTGVSASTREAS